ncbi:MAG: hypothetical protein IKR14_00180 [Lachnospiraceae bacterium]|nr:hypothetical protein [Lachnospiraceae bacterium]
MTVEELCNSIYLGDRYCENVEIRNNKIVFQINLISRIKEGSNERNFYADKDLERACLVFDCVEDFSIENGSTINDEIEIHYLANEDGIYHFIVEGAEYSDDASTYKWVKYNIMCRDFYLLHNDIIIRE